MVASTLRRTWSIVRPRRDLEPPLAPTELPRNRNTLQKAIAENTDTTESQMSKSSSPYPSQRPRERQLFENSQATQHFHIFAFAQLSSTSCRTHAHPIADFKTSRHIGR
ncbi:hypothetical protein SMACR_12820 [Sordaria macrospora]|uniref:WGS project CABT00000000 data, contig 2.8 n=2 Tax=Sordaria macrospora TaxID=5147 RepID=F7VUM2_SORMK|nr:uncharacterized protein SMAC_12820 [Sordaria macrospora k-hell]KAA8628565.1 hypothetical protein SMACR_12820 [Sordaria macrospora]KAH7628579.1 hypothetical protein B0T09DRAFT_163835 [Sordaria sp. MPI-SDFR-AT-0083]CCC09218.1 unnamed protein product [Sordaria macrospora k-hell]